MDALADAVGVTTKELRQYLSTYGLRAVYGEAERLAAAAAWEKQVWPAPPPLDSHLVAAARDLLELP